MVLARDNLGDAFDIMLAVAGIDALGTVAKAKVSAAGEAREALQFGPANLLGDPGIDGAFIDHDRRSLGTEQASDGAGGR